MPKIYIAFYYLLSKMLSCLSSYHHLVKQSEKVDKCFILKVKKLRHTKVIQ